MNSYDFTHLTLYAIADESREQPSLQETVYFISLLAKNEADMEYRRHFHGPYSNEVSESLNKLKALGFARESTAAYKESAAEVARHSCILTSDGIHIAMQKAKKYPTAWRRIKKAAKQFDSAGNVSRVEMAVAAKAYFTSKQTESNICEEITRNLEVIESDSREIDSQEIVTFLKHLGLA